MHVHFALRHLDNWHVLQDALAQAIQQLTDIDHFNIIQFDHEQTIWSPTGPVAATASNRCERYLASGPCLAFLFGACVHSQQALQWIGGIQARGTTDILTPLKMALNTLENFPVNLAGGLGLPLIFLLTDGCVRDEREICQYVEAQRRRVRIMTMGIGKV